MKSSQAGEVYNKIKQAEFRILKLETELQRWVNLLDSEEMVKYVEISNKLNQKWDEKEEHYKQSNKVYRRVMG